VRRQQPQDRLHPRGAVADAPLRTEEQQGCRLGRAIILRSRRPGAKP
jgi:hypothetical protein